MLHNFSRLSIAATGSICLLACAVAWAGPPGSFSNPQNNDNESIGDFIYFQFVSPDTWNNNLGDPVDLDPTICSFKLLDFQGSLVFALDYDFEPNKDLTETNFFDAPFEPSVYPAPPGFYSIRARIGGEDPIAIAEFYTVDVNIKVD